MLLYIIIAFGGLVTIPNDVTSYPAIEETKQVVNNIHFHLYTRKNTKQPYNLQFRSDVSLSESPLNHGVQTVFVVHGFNENENSESVQGIKDAYLQHGAYNIILVSWSQFTTMSWYLNSVGKIPVVGSYVGKLIIWLADRRAISIPNLHAIGFSLGAHVCSHIGKELINDHRPKIGRITGLDPAGPGFDKFAITDSFLTKADATFVDIIHTDPAGFGIQSVIGHADFYVNYGRVQPDCGIINFECSHGRAWHYYVESISNPYGFPASTCATWSPSVSNCVWSKNVFMGFALDRRTRGIFYVETNSQFPFSRKSRPSVYKKRVNIPQNKPHGKEIISFYTASGQPSSRLGNYYQYSK